MTHPSRTPQHPFEPCEVSHLRLRVAGVWLLALAFTVTVATTLLVVGPFLWHVQQAAAWQGALEALLLTALLFVALQWRAPTAVRALLLALPAALYLRRHHVDLVLPIVLAYAEGLVLLGLTVLRALREDGTRSDAWLRNLIAGVALLSLCLWTAQAFGAGTPREQRLLALVLLLPLLAWHWRRLQSAALLRAAFVLQRPLERAWAAALIATLLVLLARSNVVDGFDEAWYGLRPERVLVGEHSVFDALGFVSPVYYFPKLYEVLLLPLSAMREYSVVRGFGIVLGGLIARLAYDMLCRLGHTRAVALAGATVVWSLPALAGASIGPKPDVFVALLAVAMVWFGWNLRQGRRADLAWVFACAGVAVSAKLVAFAYVGAAGLGCLVALAMARATPELPELQRRDGLRAGIGVLVIATLVCLFVAARTWWLTGMPTIGPDPLVALWRLLGMELRSPVGTLDWIKPQDWADVPAILLGWIANPSALSHLQASWPGNVWLFLPLAALLWPRGAPSSGDVPRWLLWPVPAMGLLLLVTVGFTNRGGDGNYFIAPVALATVAGVDLLFRRAGTAAATPALMGSFVLFVGLHAALSFVSAGWGLGTRAWDLDFGRSNRDSVAEGERLLESAKLGGVAHWLHGQGGQLRVVSERLPALAAFRLPARFEGLPDMLYARWEVLADTEAFKRLLGCARVELVLLPIVPDDPSPIPALHEVLEAVHALPASRDVYRDADWRLVRVGDLLPPCAVEAGELPTASR